MLLIEEKDTAADRELRFRIQNKAKTRTASVPISQHLGLIIPWALPAVLPHVRELHSGLLAPACHIPFPGPEKLSHGFLCSGF